MITQLVIVMKAWTQKMKKQRLTLDGLAKKLTKLTKLTQIALSAVATGNILCGRWIKAINKCY